MGAKTAEPKDALSEYWKSPEYAARQKDLATKERRNKAIIIGSLFLSALVTVPIAAWLVSQFSIHGAVAFLQCGAGDLGPRSEESKGPDGAKDRTGGRSNPRWMVLNYRKNTQN